MAAIHVFAIDWVPAAADVASGGGLRSLQIIEALRDAGHAVTWSVPSSARHLRRIGVNSPALHDIEIHSADNQIELLKKLRPEIVFWLAPFSRTVPFTGLGEMIHVCDLIGLPHIEASLGAPGLQGPLRQRMGRLCANADLVLTGCEEQNGYWLAELSRDGTPPPTAIVPYALPASLRTRQARGKAALTRLHVTGMVYAWSTSIAKLERVADWLTAHPKITLSAIIGTDPGGATDQSVLKKLATLSTRPQVEMPGEVSLAKAMADYRPGSLSLDLYEPNMERQMAVPIRTVNALTHGVPILSTVDSSLMRRLRSAGAGVIAADTSDQPLEAALDRLAALPATKITAMSNEARHFADTEYSSGGAAEALLAGLEDAIARHAARRQYLVSVRQPAKATAKAPHVLVISNVEPHHRELRIDVPFTALFGQQAISGYSVWSRGDFSFTTSSNLAEQHFDAIWVQREISPEIVLALRSLARPYVYDLDDNLLATPGHRPAFSVVMMQTVRNLLWSCAVLSCSTARLGYLLQKAAMAELVDKVVVTPNLLREAPAPRPVGAPRALVWVSSDTPALTRSRTEVIRALRDFCLSYRLKLVCFGAEPPDLILESKVETVHIRQAPYGSYLAMLRSFAPGIMACPLEAEAEGGSADFIDAKSDIKMLEVLASGLTGVFSRARPYTESDLPQPILCENSYSGWMEGLQDAWNQCARVREEPVMPPNRYASPLGTLPWLDAILAARLPRPLSCAQFKETVIQWRGRYGHRLLSEAEFDEAFYLRRFPDVRQAINDRTVANAYVHYLNDGFREGRQGAPGDPCGPHNEEVWANLLHTLGDLRTAVGNQARYIESLKARRSIRLAMNRQAGG